MSTTKSHQSHLKFADTFINVQIYFGRCFGFVGRPKLECPYFKVTGSSFRELNKTWNFKWFYDFIVAIE